MARFESWQGKRIDKRIDRDIMLISRASCANNGRPFLLPSFGWASESLERTYRMKEEWNNRLWMDVAAHGIAVWLIRIGGTRQRWSLRLLLAIFPDVVGLAMCIEEIYRPGNSLLWILGPNNDGTSDDVLAEVNEIIERAPTPFGNDNFIIVVERRASLPGDGNGSDLTPERVESTLDHRTLVEKMVLRGSRWNNWKRGNSKQELLEVLAKAIPTVETSATLIRAAVMGRSMARLAARVA